MLRPFSLLILVLTFWCVGTMGAHAQALLAPPFGLKWGDNPSKLLDWADRQKLDVSIDLPGDKPDHRHLRIKSPTGTLPQHDASSLEARFAHGRLYEVTLHYADPKLNVHRTKAKFLDAKKALIAKYGAFKLSGKKKDLNEGFMRETISYHIEPVSGLFLMITYTELNDTLRQSSESTFSLIYHNENVLPLGKGK